MNYFDHNFIEITQQTKLRVALVERVKPCCSTSSTQPKCMGLTRRTRRVVSIWDVTKWNLGFTWQFANLQSVKSWIGQLMD